MSQLISSKVSANADNLMSIWNDNWQLVKEQESSNKKVTLGINQLRLSIRNAIKSLR